MEELDAIQEGAVGKCVSALLSLDDEAQQAVLARVNETLAKAKEPPAE